MEKMGMKSTDLPHGIIKGATDRLWKAIDALGGNDAWRVATRINLDPKYVLDLANLAATLAVAGREDRSQTLEQIRQLDT